MNTEFRDIVIKHYQKPESFGFTNEANCIKTSYNSEFCVDDLTLELLLNGDKIETANFEGQACTIATSAIDIFCISLKSKTKKQAKEIMNKFEQMLKDQKPEANTELGMLGYFGLVSNQPNRIRCAMIPVELFRKVL